MKLVKKLVVRCKQHFFSAKVVDRWNELAEKIILATSVNGFAIQTSISYLSA